MRGVAADGKGRLPRSEEGIATAVVDAMVGWSLGFLKEKAMSMMMVSRWFCSDGVLDSRSEFLVRVRRENQPK